MKKSRQRFFGWVLFLSGLSLVGSTFIPELLRRMPILINGTDFISLYVGVIIILIGYSGIKARW